MKIFDVHGCENRTFFLMYKIWKLIDPLSQFRLQQQLKEWAGVCERQKGGNVHSGMESATFVTSTNKSLVRFPIVYCCLQRRKGCGAQNGQYQCLSDFAHPLSSVRILLMLSQICTLTVRRVRCRRRVTRLSGTNCGRSSLRTGVWLCSGAFYQKLTIFQQPFEF